MHYKHKLKNEVYMFDNTPVNILWKKFNKLIVLRGTNLLNGEPCVVVREYGINTPEPYILDGTLVISEEYFNENFQGIK